MIHTRRLATLALASCLSAACGRSPTHETRAVVDWLVAERDALRTERDALQHALDERRAERVATALPWRDIQGLAPAGDASRGSPFLLACPEALRMVGLRGRRGAVIDRLAPVCGRPEQDALPAHRIEVQLPAAGGGGGKPFEMLCTPGEAVRGYRIAISRRDVLGLQLSCASVHATGAPPRPRWIGPALTARTLVRECPAGTWLVGFTGFSSHYVHRLGGLCRATERPPTPSAP